VHIHTALFLRVILGLFTHNVISGCISTFIGTGIGIQGSGGHSSSGGGTGSCGVTAGVTAGVTGGVCTTGGGVCIGV
jgi:hypothetical protein